MGTNGITVSGFAVWAVLVMSGIGSALAQPVTDCDRLAGSPHDPDRVADGVRIDHIDVTAAIPACLKAVKASPHGARLHFQFGRALEAAQRYPDALAQYRVAGDAGYAMAWNNMGHMYDMGHGVDVDYSQAMTLFRKAADHDIPIAQYNVGLLYAQGRGTAQDPVEAVHWFRKAADLHNPLALGILGDFYRQGRGVAQDFSQAASYYRQAAEMGNVPSQINLAILYEQGSGVPKDHGEAARWYAKAAAEGSAEGQFGLGILADQGLGQAQDYAQAVQWYRLAAEQGYAPAQTNLGFAYESGHGVSQDYDMAADLYRKAAMQGNPYAQKNFGAMLELGRGVPKDYVAAYGWYDRAAQQLDIGARERDRLAAKMTTAQIAQARTTGAGSAPIQPQPAAARMAPATGLSLVVPATLRTSEETVALAGSVNGGGKLMALKVDGSAAPFSADGGFSFRRAVPVGDSAITLAATDEWGRVAQAVIKVTRTISDDQDASVQQLNPFKAHAAQRPQALALIIGIESYQSAPPAEFAESDARAFYDYAVHALGVPPTRIKLLTGQEARRLDIRRALVTWLKPMTVKGQTEVFVFFSGHGLASDDGGDTYLLPYDGDRSLLAESAIRRKDILDVVEEAGASQATVFLDTCFAGQARGGATLTAQARPVSLIAKTEAVPPNVTILAASGNDQVSNAFAPSHHGLFSYFLMRGLEGEAADGQRRITGDSLEQYVAAHVSTEAAKLGHPQSPQLIGDGGRVISAW